MKVLRVLSSIVLLVAFSFLSLNGEAAPLCLKNDLTLEDFDEIAQGKDLEHYEVCDWYTKEINDKLTRVCENAVGMTPYEAMQNIGDAFKIFSYRLIKACEDVSESLSKERKEKNLMIAVLAHEIGRSLQENKKTHAVDKERAQEYLDLSCKFVKEHGYTIRDYERMVRYCTECS